MRGQPAECYAIFSVSTTRNFASSVSCITQRCRLMSQTSSVAPMTVLLEYFVNYVSLKSPKILQKYPASEVKHKSNNTRNRGNISNDGQFVFGYNCQYLNEFTCVRLELSISEGTQFVFGYNCQYLKEFTCLATAVNT
jgi:hypothetical protein